MKVNNQLVYSSRNNTLTKRDSNGKIVLSVKLTPQDINRMYFDNYCEDLIKYSQEQDKKSF